MTKRFAWEISPKNSAIQFKVKWFGISSISRQFAKFRATVLADQSFTNPEIYLFIESNSAEVPDEKWNNALKDESFLSVSSHPVIEFTSVGGCRQSSGKIWELSGRLSVKGIQKDITMVVSASEIKRDKKKMTAVFHLFGSVSRTDFSLHCPSEENIADDVQLNAVITMTSVDD